MALTLLMFSRFVQQRRSRALISHLHLKGQWPAFFSNRRVNCVLGNAISSPTMQTSTGRLEVNSMGVPTEGYGFGNDAQGFLSAPSIDAAAITIGDADVSTSVTLNYTRASSTKR
jgi:Uncharacterized protein conserved in bacteria (DUF2141)